MTQEEKKKLLEKHHVFQYLSHGKILSLCIWEHFNKKRLDVFFDGLSKGKSAEHAFIDAKTQTK